MIRVPVETEPTFRRGNPEVLWEREYYADIVGGTSYDIHPDGDRFLMLKVLADDEVSKNLRDLVVVENWFEELKRLAPVPEHGK